MTRLFVAAAAAPSIAIELPAALTWVLGMIAALIAVIGFFLHRELKSNDEVHRDLRADVKTVEADVKKLLEGDVAWVRALLKGQPPQ